MLKNHVSGWGLISQGFHWLTALLIFLAVILGLIAEDMENSPAKIKLFVLHKSFGISVLFLLALRLPWRWLNAVAQPSEDISAANQRLAQVGHLLLYLLMFAVPLSGWVLNSAANFPFRWFNWFSIPGLAWIPSAWKQSAMTAHWWLFMTLAILVIGHAAMAIVHQRLHRGDLMLRMLPTASMTRFFSAFVLVLLVILIWSWYWSQSAPTAATSSVSLQTREANTQNMPEINQSQDHTDFQWKIVEGKLAFSGRYAQEPFEGEFKSYSADLFFDPQTPEAGLFRVTIDTASVTAYSEDFDSALVEPQWFDVKRYPQASYQSTDFQVSGSEFVANGILTIKGFQASVPLTFQWIANQRNEVSFSATTIIDRRTFGIGLGEWAEDPTIGFDIKIWINLNLTRIDSGQ